MSNINYHKAKQIDIEILVDYRIEFLEEYWGRQTAEIRKALQESLKDYLAKALEEKSYICYLAKSGEEVVGIGALVIRQQPGSFKNPTGKVGYLMNMYTRPAFRRKGICKQLLNLLTEDARSQGITAFELHATHDGEYVYKQEGFKLHGEPTYRKYID